MITKLFNTHKKGAVELSLNLIIMLVIGLTVLGLIIAFVTGFLGDATEGIGQLTPGDEEILRDLASRPGNFEFHRRDVTVRRGNEVRLFAKFENPLSAPVTVHDQSEVEQDTSRNFHFQVSDTGQGLTDPGLFRVFMAPLDLGASQSDALAMDLRVDSQVPTGNYFLSFTVNFEDANGNERQYTNRVTITVE